MAVSDSTLDGLKSCFVIETDLKAGRWYLGSPKAIDIEMDVFNSNMTLIGQSLVASNGYGGIGFFDLNPDAITW
jgi:hypothetical protein